MPKSKNISEFYKHKEMLDGHLNKCKECTKNDMHKHRTENIEKIRKYDRERPNKEDRNKKNCKRIKCLRLTDFEKYNEIHKSNLDWAKKNKHKRNAHNLVKRHLTNKGLKQNKCEKCGIENVDIQAHHDDYSKPLDIVWLCIKCHAERHKELNEIKRNLKDKECLLSE